MVDSVNNDNDDLTHFLFLALLVVAKKQWLVVYNRIFNQVNKFNIYFIYASVNVHIYRNISCMVRYFLLKTSVAIYQAGIMKWQS